MQRRSRRVSGGGRSSQAVRASVCACLLWQGLAVTGCVAGFERFHTSDDRGVEFACSAYNPLMQSSIFEAVVAGGGPGLVDVAGWMCGRVPHDYVRIVMLRYESVHPGEPNAIVPAVFEHGALIAFGWHLLEKQPERYGTSVVPDGEHPWRVPSGWSSVRIVVGE